MDPDATLAELRTLLGNPDSPPNNFDDATRAAELFESLDNWITAGGFLPDAWSRAAS